MWLIPCWSPWRLALTLWHLASRRVSLSANPWQIVSLFFFFPFILLFFSLQFLVPVIYFAQSIIHGDVKTLLIWKNLERTLIFGILVCFEMNDFVPVTQNWFYWGWTFEISNPNRDLFFFSPHLWNNKSTVSEFDIFYVAMLSLGFQYVWV